MQSMSECEGGRVLFVLFVPNCPGLSVLATGSQQDTAAAAAAGHGGQHHVV